VFCITYINMALEYKVCMPRVALFIPSLIQQWNSRRYACMYASLCRQLLEPTTFVCVCVCVCVCLCVDSNSEQVEPGAGSPGGSASAARAGGCMGTGIYIHIYIHIYIYTHQGLDVGLTRKPFNRRVQLRSRVSRTGTGSSGAKQFQQPRRQ
jgi:hypothetical protein